MAGRTHSIAFYTPPPAPEPDSPFAAEYYTVAQLTARGWTRTLRLRFLKAPDHRLPVYHWLNWTGKNAYLVRRVHLAEITSEFETAFRQSAHRRRLAPDFVQTVLDRIGEHRAAGIDKVIEVADFADAKLARAAAGWAALISEARARGYRTPHKC